MIRDLLTQLAVLSAVCTCVLIICPGSTVKRYVKLSCSLCVLSLIISFIPFNTDISLSNNTAVSVTDLTEEARNMIKEQTASHVCDAVYELAYDKYGIDKGGIFVSVSYSERGDGVTEFTKAEIELSGIKYAVLTVPLKNSVSDLLGIPCEVVVNE